MQKKLLFLSVLSFGVAFSAFAQDAPLKKVFNSGATNAPSGFYSSITVSDNFLFEYDSQTQAVFKYDTTVTSSHIDSLVILDPSQTQLRNADFETVGEQMVLSVNFENGGDYINYLSLFYADNLVLGSGISNTQFGKVSYYTSISSISDSAFVAFDSANTRLIRFKLDPSTQGGIKAVKEVDMVGFISANDVGGIGGRRDFEVYYVWDKANNAIKRFDPNGNEGTNYDFDSQTFASGRILTIESMIVEDNGRIVVAVNDQPAGAAKSLTPSTKRLVFFGGGFQFLGDVELPVGGPRGDYSSITDIDVDYDGNIYIAQAGDRKIRMLDDFNSPPFNNNSNQFSQVVLKQPIGFYPITKDMIAFQDWNIEDTVVAIRMYPSIGQNSNISIYYDANNDGIYDGIIEEISNDNTDSLDIPISDIIAGRLVVEDDINLFSPGNIEVVFSYKWSDGTGFNPVSRGNILVATLGNKATINGVQGKDGWRLLAPTRIGLSYGEFLAPLWTQGASGSDLPLGAPNVFTYSTKDEEWNPVTDFSQQMELGRGIAIYIYEDDDLRTPGVQGGWPKQIVLSTQKTGLTNNENFEYDLVYSSNKAQPEYQGFNLLGNPYTTHYSLRNPYFRADSSSQVLTYWEATFNNGTGRYLYLPLTPTSNQNLPLYLIAQGQGFWLQATSENSPIIFNFVGAFAGSSPIEKTTKKPELFSLKIEDGGFGDQLDIYSSATEAQKLSSLSEMYHEVYALGKFGKSLAITSGDFEQEVIIPIGIRSTTSNQATFTIDQSKLSAAFSSVRLVQEFASGETESYELGEGPVSLSLKREGEEWVHEGALSLVLSNSQSVSNEGGEELPTRFEMGTYPNPFNPTTQIEYALPQAARVTIQVFNVTGQKVVELVSNQAKEAGVHQQRLDLSQQSSGIYLVRITAGSHTLTRKITLIK